MKRFNVEIAVGIFLVAGFLCFAYLSVRLGDVHIFGNNTYPVYARFGSVSGLKNNAIVEIAGVRVGQVASITLDRTTYEAVVRFAIDDGVKLPDDSIAAIRTSGIIGDKYVDISPGGSEQNIKAGGRITQTQSAINLEELIGKYIFQSQKK